MLVLYKAISNILWPFGKFCAHLVNIFPFWNVEPKNPATLVVYFEKHLPFCFSFSKPNFTGSELIGKENHSNRFC
jgi:hypothetical protein